MAAWLRVAAVVAAAVAAAVAAVAVPPLVSALGGGARGGEYEGECAGEECNDEAEEDAYWSGEGGCGEGELLACAGTFARCMMVSTISSAEGRRDGSALPRCGLLLRCGER